MAFEVVTMSRSGALDKMEIESFEELGEIVAEKLGELTDRTTTDGDWWIELDGVRIVTMNPEGADLLWAYVHMAEDDEEA